MTDLLSQDEIDALLHGVDDVDDVDEPIENDNEGAVNFDFSSQDRIDHSAQLARASSVYVGLHGHCTN